MNNISIRSELIEDLRELYAECGRQKHDVFQEIEKIIDDLIFQINKGKHLGFISEKPTYY